MKKGKKEEPYVKEIHDHMDVGGEWFNYLSFVIVSPICLFLHDFLVCFLLCIILQEMVQGLVQAMEQVT